MISINKFVQLEHLDVFTNTRRLQLKMEFMEFYFRTLLSINSQILP